MKIPKDLYDSFREERKKIEFQGRYERITLDKVILLLSTGAIILSINFLVNLMKNNCIFSLWLFSVSLCMLLLSIIILMIGYIISEHNFKKGSEYFDNLLKYLSRGILVPSSRDKKYEDEREKLNKITRLFNYFTFIFLVSGLIFLGIFVLINLNKINENNMTNCEQNNKIEETDEKANINLTPGLDLDDEENEQQDEGDKDDEPKQENEDEGKN